MLAVGILSSSVADGMSRIAYEPLDAHSTLSAICVIQSGLLLLATSCMHGKQSTRCTVHDNTLLCYALLQALIFSL